jgi:hypothetical protein
MVALIKQWRQLFGHDFYYLWGALGRGTNSAPPLQPVTVAHYRTGRNLQFLEAQRIFGYDGKERFVDFADLGNNETHWGQKQRGGERFAAAAMSLVYEKSMPYTGPQRISFARQPGEIRITYTHVGDGLVYKPSINGISGFILESGSTVKWIEPLVEGTDTLVFKDPEITETSNLFYGYHNNGHETLFNSVGLSASIMQLVPGNYPRAADPTPLVTLLKSGEKGVALHISHVRSQVIVLSATLRKGSAVNRVAVLVPASWAQAAAQHQGKDIGVQTVERNNQRFIELDVQTNAGPYVIYNTEMKDQALQQADLSRF